METVITLDKYLKMGGKIENLDLSKTKTTFFDKNRDKTIESITLNGSLYLVEFVDHTLHNYASTWIKTIVILKLEDKFTN